MKRLQNLSFTGANQKQQITRNTIDIPKGRILKNLRCKFTIPLANSSGGAVVLTDAQKQTLLDLFSFSLNFGKDGMRKSIDQQVGSRVHRFSRYCLQTEIEKYTDSTNGLSTSLPNSATTSVIAYVNVPVSLASVLELNRLTGMGRTQARSAQLEIQLGSSLTVLTGVVISGTVSVDVFPDTKPCKGDVYGAVPFFRTSDTSADEIESPEEGIPLLAGERTAVHASSTLTSVNVSIDQELIHEAVGPADIITEQNDNMLQSSAGMISDRITILFQVQPGDSLRDLSTGKVKVKQVVKNLSTFLGEWYFLPRITEDEVTAALQHATQSARNKQLKAISQGKVRGVMLADRLEACMGFQLVDRDDREFEQFPGMVLSPGESTPVLMIPDSVRARATSGVAALNASGEQKAADKVQREIAAAVPGAVPSTRGFARGSSPVLAKISQLIR